MPSFSSNPEYSTAIILVVAICYLFFFFFQAEDGIRDHCVTGVQTCALPISLHLLAKDGTEVSRETADNETVPTFLEARVEPIALPLSDPLARIDGLLNAIAIQTDTPADVMGIGPGAGRFQAGQENRADLVA